MPETPGQKIQRQIAAIKAQGGSDADVAAFLSAHPDVQQESAPDKQFSDVTGGSSNYQTPGRKPIRGNVGMDIVNGLTFGAGDRIDAAARTVLPQVLGGSEGFDYGKTLQDVRAARQQYDSENKKTAFVADLAGSIPTTVATAGLGKLAPAAIGAFGGVMGSDGSLGDAVSGGLKGAAIGTVGAGLMHGAGKIAGAVGRAAGVPEMVANAATRLSAGRTGLLGTLAASIGSEGAANTRIATRLASENTTPQDIVKKLAGQVAGSGDKPQILADLSPEVSKLTKTLTKQPGAGRAAINKVLSERSAATADRVSADLGSGKGVPQSIAPTFTALVNDRAQSAETHFATAYQAGAGGLDDPALSQIMQRPTVLSLWRDAQRVAADEGVKLPTRTVTTGQVPPIPPQMAGIDPSKWAAQATAQGLVPTAEVPIPDVRAIHYMDQVLRSQVDAGFGGKGPIKTPGHAAILQKTIDEIRGRVAQHVPEFDAALADFSSKSQLIDAVKTGSNIRSYVAGSSKAVPGQAMGKGDPLELKAIRQGVAGLEAAVANMNPQAQQLFRQSAKAALSDALANAPSTLEGSTNSTVTKIFGSRSSAGRWQRLLFESPQEAAAFRDGLGRERQMAITNARMGGSDTAENTLESATLNPHGLKAWLHRPISTTLGAGDEIASRAERDALGRKLSASGYQDMNKVLHELLSVQALRGQASTAGTALRNAIATKPTR